MSKYIIIIFSVITLFTACNKVPKDWKQISKTDYSFSFPPKWELDTSRVMGTEFMLFSPLENDSDRFKENINLYIEQIEPTISLDSFANRSLNQIITLISNSKDIQIQPCKIDHQDARKIIFNGNGESLLLKMQQIYIKKSNKIYILTFSAQNEKYDQYSPDIELILNNFQFK